MTHVDPTLPARLELEKQQVNALFDSWRAGGSRQRAPGFSLVDAGLEMISRSLQP